MDGRWVGWVAAVVCETDCGQCEEDVRFRLERAPSTTISYYFYYYDDDYCK